MRTTRRAFLQGLSAGAAALALPGCYSLGRQEKKMPPNSRQWRGFNLLEKFTDRQNAPFQRDDFWMISDWGFSFVRLPMSYWCWSTPDDPFVIDEKVIGDLDDAIELGEKHGIHVNLNIHRAPGYCVNPPEEPMDLWTDKRAQDAFKYLWNYFTNRYKGISSEILSFDLLNEPSGVELDVYEDVMRQTIEVIHSSDPDRLVVVDGMRYGRDPVPGLVDTGVWQSTRGYDPMVISHLHASWINRDTWPEHISWPHEENGSHYDKEWLKEYIIDPWMPLVREGTTVHVGEWGVYNQTSHEVALAYMADYLDLWKAVDWGWALWNLRGSFGILNSGRSDVSYEKIAGGYELDRKMLSLLQAG